MRTVTASAPTRLRTILPPADIRKDARPRPVKTALTVLDYLPLIKPKIIVLLAVTGLVSALVAGRGHVAPGRLLLFVLVAFMSSGGAACLNHLFERDVDALMERTRTRPLPSGRVTPTAAALLAIFLIGSALPVAWLWLGGAVALQLALGVGIYSGLYTLVLKRRTPMNIVIGGIAGGNMALGGWAVADPSLHAGAWLLALVIFLWTPPHFWGLAIARDADYRAAGFPMLPQVAGVERTARSMALYAAATWAVSLLMARYIGLGPVYLISAGILGAAFTGACVWLWLRPGRRLAMAVFKTSGPYLALLFVSMAFDLWAHI